MKIQLFFILLSLSLSSLFSQNERIEVKLQNCTYEQILNNGKELKEEIKEFEDYLVGRKILNDHTGKSYVELYKQIIKEDDVQFDYNYSFADSIQKIIILDVNKQMDCQIDLINSDSYIDTKVYKLMSVMDSLKLSEDIYPAIVANGILSVLDERDFELDYYKIKTFVLLDATNLSSDITYSLVKNEKLFLAKALKIYLNKKSEILVDNKKVTIKKLKKSIREYELKNKSESIIVLKTERETRYKIYIEVQSAIVGEINSLRKQISIKKYNTEFNNLTKNQLVEVKRIYPQKIVEE